VRRHLAALQGGGKRARGAVGVLAGVLLLVAGCGGSTPAQVVPTPVSFASSQPSTPAATPALRTAAAPGVTFEGGRTGALWELAGFRHELLADRVRLIWEMEGGTASVPRYALRAVDNGAEPHPVAPGPLWGQVRVDLIFFDLYAREFPLREHFPVEAFDATSPVVRVGLYPTFDDAALGFSVGLRRRAPLEVYEVENPPRLVVDVLREP